jgi:hypothetical protein
MRNLRRIKIIISISLGMVNKSIFDSKAEEKLFKRLKTFWSKHLDVFPQLPPRNVFGYQAIQDSRLTSGAKKFLLETSFDFVVCDPKDHSPLLVIEFDGLTNGFSREGKYVKEKEFKDDPFRSLKMETKLNACQLFDIPAIVISYQECNLLPESENMINVLDVIIADAIEKHNHAKNYQKYTNMIAQSYQEFGQDGADNAIVEIEVMSEQANPVKRRISEMTKGFPNWATQFYFTKPDDKGNFNETFHLDLGIKTVEGAYYTKRVLSVNVGLRCVGAFLHDPVFLFNTIGEYCLAMKTKKTLGYDRGNWSNAYEQTAWIKR